MADFGVTADGFVLKPVDVILSESLDRARAAFGADVDLTSTSALRKILETVAAEDGELWKRLEDLYYSNFISTAVGDNLDLLGEDAGLRRPFLRGTGSVRVTLAGTAVPGRTYVVPEGAIVVTSTSATGAIAFATTAPLNLDTIHPVADVGVIALDPGPGGNVAAAAIVDFEPAYRSTFITDLGGATLSLTNPAATTGGDAPEDDDTYRSRLLGLARNLWTTDSIVQAALGVTGVLDVVISDPLGGVDVSQSYFDLFRFNQRAFNSERRVGQPYFFTIVVAHEFRAPWRTTGPVPGIFERVSAAIDKVRPIGIYANIVEADHIEVGVRATVVTAPGSDGPALLAAVRQRLARDFGALRLGGDVLHSQVVRAFVEQPGVLDVQNVHLRRAPAAFGRITFGDVQFQRVLAEPAVGENLVMGPTELAILATSFEVLDVAVVTR
jgi:uncharacterized phage protein gp47/JayE